MRWFLRAGVGLAVAISMAGVSALAAEREPVVRMARAWQEDAASPSDAPSPSDRPAPMPPEPVPMQPMLPPPAFTAPGKAHLQGPVGGDHSPVQAKQGAGIERLPCLDDCCWEPLWTFRAGALYLKRERHGAAPILTGGPDSTLNAADFDFGYEWGFDISGTRRINDCWSLELRYFEVDDWTATSPDAPPPSTIEFATPGFVGITTFSPSYQSELRSFEANAHRQWGESVTFILGFRYLKLQERLALEGAIGGVPSSTLDIDADNDLYGGQIGVAGLLFQRGRFSVDGFVKAGVYYNEASNRLTATGLALTDVAFDDNRTAFVGEVGVHGNYWITERFAARVGYQLLWVEGVATAGDQVGALDPINAAGAVDASGGVFYHGFFFGGEYLW